MLEYLITSKAKRRLLKLFITNPDRDFYTREIAKLTGEHLNAVRRELGHLEKAGLIRSRREGNLKYYSLVKEFPFYPELKKIIYATIGLGDYLTAKFSDSKQIEFAFIYGSVAKNEETAKSTRSEMWDALFPTFARALELADIWNDLAPRVGT